MKKRLFATFAAVAVCVLLLAAIHTQQMQQDLAGRVLRFHVLANSDSEQDQELKLKVRDEIGTMMAEKLQDVDSLDECREIVRENLQKIETLAENTIAAAGYTYPVKAVLENCTFPEKTYGMFTFPSGNYEALRVVIGEGEGHNWWCVMYPNLCFSGSMYEVDEQSGETLRETLSEEEYAAVLEEGNYKIKFKILRFMNRVLE